MAGFYLFIVKKKEKDFCFFLHFERFLNEIEDEGGDI